MAINPPKGSRLELPTFVVTDTDEPAFDWDVRRPRGSFAEPTQKQKQMLERLSYSSLSALSIGATEWIVLALWRGLNKRDRQTAWTVLEWLWLQHLNGLPSRYCRGPSTARMDWQARCASATRLALKLALSTSVADMVQLGGLAEHVVAATDPYRLWHQQIVKRLRPLPKERVATARDRGPFRYYFTGGTCEVDQYGQENETYPPPEPKEYWVTLRVPREVLDPDFTGGLERFDELSRKLIRRLRSSSLLVPCLEQRK